MQANFKIFENNTTQLSPSNMAKYLCLCYAFSKYHTCFACGKRDESNQRDPENDRHASNDV